MNRRPRLLDTYCCQGGVTRLPQPRLRPGRGPAVNTNAYDPAIPSDGNTLDTPRGPVDLVAVARALLGIPTALTAADVAYAVSLLTATHGPAVDQAAHGLGVKPQAVQRAVVRRHATERDQNTNRPDRTDTTDRNRT